MVCYLNGSMEKVKGVACMFCVMSSNESVQLFRWGMGDVRIILIKMDVA